MVWAYNWVKKCTRMNVIGVVDRGAPRKTWRSCVKRDMKAMGIKEEMAQDRCAWILLGVRPVLRGCLKYRVCFGVTRYEYDDDDDIYIYIYIYISGYTYTSYIKELLIFYLI